MRVTTEASIYQLEGRWLTRFRRAGSAKLRRDGEPIFVHYAEQPVVGRPWTLRVQVREDAIGTIRISTPVVRVEL